MKSKTRKIVIAVIGVILIGSVGFFYINKASQEATAAKEKANSEKYIQLVSDAKKYANNNQYDLAIDAYLEAIELKPEEEGLYVNVADLYYDAEEFDEELEFLTETMPKFEDNEELQQKYTIVSAVQEIVTNDNVSRFGKDGDLYWCVDNYGSLMVAGDGDFVGQDGYGFGVNVNFPYWLGFNNTYENTDIMTAKFTVTNIKNTGGLLFGCQSLVSVDLTNLDTSKTTDMASMFYNCINLVELDVSSLDTSNAENMMMMFSGCTSLLSLDLSNFDTSHVYLMTDTFANCESLTTLDLSSFDTSSLTICIDMFYNCYNLQSIDLSSFDVHLDSFNGMFEGCRSLTSLDLSGFDTSDVQYFERLFFDCSSLTSLDLSNFDTSNGTQFTWMFEGCSSLKSLDLSNFDFSNGWLGQEMFADCTSLEYLDLSGFNPKSNENMARFSMNEMFRGCTNLKTLIIDIDLNVCWTNCTFDGCNNLDYSQVNMHY